MGLVELLGKNVRARRKQLGLSQEVLALEAGMKRSYLSDLERGQRNPSIRALERLSQVLSVPPESLLAPTSDEGA